MKNTSRLIMCLSLAAMFIFAGTENLYSAPKDSKKSSKKEDKKSKDKKEKSKDAKKDDKTAIDTNNPYYRDLAKLAELKEEVASTSNASKKKRLNLRIKKIQDGIKSKHDRSVARLKKKISNVEYYLKRETHKDFRARYEKEIEALEKEIQKLDEYAGIAGGKKAAPASGGKNAKAPAGDDLDIPPM